MYFLFNRSTLQVFVTYLTGALHVHTLWFYEHQHDNRVRSKLSVACQRWWFEWRFWFVPSVPGYLREEEEHKPDPWRNPIQRNHMGLHLENEVYCVWQVVKTPTIILNNPVFIRLKTGNIFHILNICAYRLRLSVSWWQNWVNNLCLWSYELCPLRQELPVWFVGVRIISVVFVRAAIFNVSVGDG